MTYVRPELYLFLATVISCFFQLSHIFSLYLQFHGLLLFQRYIYLSQRLKPRQTRRTFFARSSNSPFYQAVTDSSVTPTFASQLYGNKKLLKVGFGKLVGSHFSIFPFRLSPVRFFLVFFFAPTITVLCTLKPLFIVPIKQYLPQ